VQYKEQTMQRIGIGTQLVLAALLTAASMLTVTWCFAEMQPAGLTAMAIRSLLLPPHLVFIITFVRSVVALNRAELPAAQKVTSLHLSPRRLIPAM
jgi:hypothetical protein